jgi:hypothetical protein
MSLLDQTLFFRLHQLLFLKVGFNRWFLVWGIAVSSCDVEVWIDFEDAYDSVLSR